MKGIHSRTRLSNFENESIKSQSQGYKFDVRSNQSDPYANRFSTVQNGPPLAIGGQDLSEGGCRAKGMISNQHSGKYDFETIEGHAQDNNTPGPQPSRNELNKDLQLDAFRSSPLKIGKTAQHSPKGLKTPKSTAEAVMNLNQREVQKITPSLTTSQSISLLKKQTQAKNDNEETTNVLPNIYTNLPLAEITQSDEASGAKAINEDSEKEEPEFTQSPEIQKHRELRSMFV